MLITGLINGLSVAAKATVGVSLAAAGVTSGGAAGVLPGPAQTAVAASVEAATPFSFPHGMGARSDLGSTVSTGAANGSVDGTTNGTDAGLKGGVTGPADASRPTAPGQNGLDQTYLTPALGRTPTSLPSVEPARTATQRSTSIDTATGVPDAGRLPSVVPYDASAGAAAPGTSSTQATLTGEATASLAVVAAATTSGTATVRLQGAEGTVLASADVKLAAEASVTATYSLNGKSGMAARAGATPRADSCVALTVAATGAVSGSVEATVVSSGASTTVRATVSTTNSGDVANAVVCADTEATVRT